MAILEERQSYGAAGGRGLHGWHRIGYRHLCRHPFTALEAAALRARRALRVGAGRVAQRSRLVVGLELERVAAVPGHAQLRRLRLDAVHRSEEHTSELQ